MFWPPCLLIYKEFHRPAAGERGQRAAHMSSVALRSKVGGWCSLLFTIFYPDSVLQHFLWVFGPASLGHVKKKKEYIYKVLFYLPVLLPCFFALTFVPFVCFFGKKTLSVCCIILFPFYVCSIVLNYLCRRKIFKALPNAEERRRKRRTGMAGEWRGIRTHNNKKKAAGRTESKLLFITQQHQSVKESATIPTAISRLSPPTTRSCCKPLSLHKLCTTFGNFILTIMPETT